jgi:cell division cycle 2-like
LYFKAVSDQSDEVGSNYSNRSNTPERNNHETPSESDEKDPLDEKIEDYYKKASNKKTDSEKPSTLKESEKKNDEQQQKSETILAPPPTPDIITYYCATQGSRSVEEFECLNKIEEGAYGVVFRAKDKKSSNILINF